MNVQALLNNVNAIYPVAENNTNKIMYMNIALRSLSPYFGLVSEDDSIVTVANQDSYAFPAGLSDVSQIIDFAISNQVTPLSRYDYGRYKLSKGNDDPQNYNSYFQIADSNGNKKFVIYPAPTTSGLTIVIRFHKPLTELSPTNLDFEPEFDPRYHDLLVFYCINMLASSGLSPDTIQADNFMQKYDSKLLEYWKLQMEQESSQQNRRRDNDHWHPYTSFSRGY